MRVNIRSKEATQERQVYVPPVFRRVLKTSAFNFGFKAVHEQDSIIAAWARLINSLPCSVQFLCESKVIDPNEWLLNVVDRDYETFLKDHIYKKNTVEKNFYVAFSAQDQETLNHYSDQISERLRRLGLKVQEHEPVEPNDLPDLQPNSIKVGDWYHETLIIEDWPYAAAPGWLEELYNMEKNVNISMFVHPQETEWAKKYLAKKITENGSTILIQQENDTYQGDLESHMYSAALMRGELNKNQGKFFFVSYYVTVKARELQQLKRDVRMVGALLRGLSIKYKHAMLRQDDGFRCTLPHGVDYLKSYYNFTSTPLTVFLPFLSANIIERGGILMGKNLLNQGLVFLNHFDHTDASMLILGKKGSGKSYTVKSQTDKLSKQGVEVTILDPDNEFGNIAQEGRVRVEAHGRDIQAYKVFLRKYLAQVEADYLNKRSRPRMLVIDEFWLFMQDEEMARLIQDIAKTGRKRWLALTIVTQEIDDLLQSPYARSIINNCTFKILLKMEYNQKEHVQRVFNLTDQEFSYLVGTEDGEGILFVENNHIQFQTIVSEDMHRRITTKPEETLQWGA